MEFTRPGDTHLAGHHFQAGHARPVLGERQGGQGEPGGPADCRSAQDTWVVSAIFS